MLSRNQREYDLTMGAITSGHAVLVIDEENGLTPELDQREEEADEAKEIAEVDAAATTKVQQEYQNGSTRRRPQKRQRPIYRDHSCSPFERKNQMRACPTLLLGRCASALERSRE